MKVANVAVDVAKVADELLAKVNFNDKKYTRYSVTETTKVLVGKILVAKLFRLFVATQVRKFAVKLAKFTQHCKMETQYVVQHYTIISNETIETAILSDPADPFNNYADLVDMVAGEVLDWVSADVEKLSAEVQTVINQTVIKMVADEVAARKKTTIEPTSSKVDEVIDDDDVKIISVIPAPPPAPTATAPTATAPTAKPVTHKKKTDNKRTKKCKKGACKKGAKKRKPTRKKKR